MSRRLLFLLVASSGALAAVVLVPQYLPLVDLPQHVALLSIWSHAAEPAFQLGTRYELALLTPYALSNLIAHALGVLVGPEWGLRLLLAAAVVAFPWAALALLRAFGRPEELALAAVPASLSFSYAYGFVPFVAALPLVLWGLATARRTATSACWRDAALLAAIALTTLATHAFAFAVLAALTAVLAFASRPRRPAIARIMFGYLPAAALACTWAVLRSHTQHAEPRHSGYGAPKLRFQHALASMFGADSREVRVLAITAAFAVLFALAARLTRAAARAGDEDGRRTLGWIAVAGLAAIPLFPITLLDTWGLWQRIPPVGFVALAGALPWPAGTARRTLTAGLAAIAFFAAATALAQGLWFSSDARHLRSVADHVPRGSRILWSTCGEDRVAPVAWLASPAARHLGAYIVAERGGDLSYSFAHFPHMIVRYRGLPPEAADLRAYDVAVLRAGQECPLSTLEASKPSVVDGQYVLLQATQLPSPIADRLLAR